MVYKIKFYSSDETVKLEYTKNVGLDIKSIEDIKLKPNGITKVKTGIHICNNIVKNNWYETNQTFFKVEGRSGVACKLE
jgi:dUTPase